MDTARIYTYGVALMLLLLPFANAGIIGGSGTASDPYLWNISCGESLSGLEGAPESGPIYITVINDIDCANSHADYALYIHDSYAVDIDFNNHHIANANGAYGVVVANAQYIHIHNLWLTGKPLFAIGVVGNDTHDISIGDTHVEATGDNSWALALLGNSETNGVMYYIDTYNSYFKATSGGVLVYLGCTAPADEGQEVAIYFYQDYQSTFDLRDGGVLYVTPSEDMCAAEQEILDSGDPSGLDTEVLFMNTTIIGQYGTSKTIIGFYIENMAQEVECVDPSDYIDNGDGTYIRTDVVQAQTPLVIGPFSDIYSSLPVAPLHYSMLTQHSFIVGRERPYAYDSTDLCVNNDSIRIVVYNQPEIANCSKSSMWWWDGGQWVQIANCSENVTLDWWTPLSGGGDIDVEPSPEGLIIHNATYFWTTPDMYVDNYTDSNGYLWHIGKFVGMTHKTPSLEDYLQEYGRAVEVMFDSSTPAVGYTVEYWFETPQNWIGMSAQDLILKVTRGTFNTMGVVPSLSAVEKLVTQPHILIARTQPTNEEGIAPIVIENKSLFTDQVFNNIVYWVVYDNENHVVAKGHTRVPKLHVIMLAPTMNFMAMVYEGLTARSNLLIMAFIISAVAIGLFGLSNGGLVAAILNALLLLILYAYQPFDISQSFVVIVLILVDVLMYGLFRS